MGEGKAEGYFGKILYPSLENKFIYELKGFRILSRNPVEVTGDQHEKLEYQSA